MKKMFLLMTIALMSVYAAAATPDFRNISKQDIEDASEEFHANFIPTTVSGASNLGRLWGFEVGLIANKTSASNIERMTSDDFSDLYNASLYGRLDAIYGVGAEVTMMPVSLGALKFKTYSFALKWTVTEVFRALPFNLKVKAFYNNADIKFEDNDGTNSYDVVYSHRGQGANLTISKKIFLVEPYLGVGYVTGKTDLEANGSTNFFGATVTQGVDNKDIKTSGSYFFAGVTANLIAIDVGVEYSRAFGADRIAAKLGFGF